MTEVLCTQSINEHQVGAVKRGVVERLQNEVTGFRPVHRKQGHFIHDVEYLGVYIRA